MMANNKIIDGQNISLVDALSQYGFKRKRDGQIVLEESGKTFVLGDLQGTVKEVSILEEDENQEAGNSANGEQEIKQGNTLKERGETPEGGDPTFGDKSSNPDNIQLAADPIKEHNIEEENKNQENALEEIGFHVVSDNNEVQRKGSRNNRRSRGVF